MAMEFVANKMNELREIKSWKTDDLLQRNSSHVHNSSMGAMMLSISDKLTEREKILIARKNQRTIIIFGF